MGPLLVDFVHGAGRHARASNEAINGFGQSTRHATVPLEGEVRELASDVTVVLATIAGCQSQELHL